MICGVRGAQPRRGGRPPWRNGEGENTTRCRGYGGLANTSPVAPASTQNGSLAHHHPTPPRHTTGPSAVLPHTARQARGRGVTTLRSTSLHQIGPGLPLPGSGYRSRAEQHSGWHLHRIPKSTSFESSGLGACTSPPWAHNGPISSFQRKEGPPQAALLAAAQQPRMRATTSPGQVLVVKALQPLAASHSSLAQSKAQAACTGGCTTPDHSFFRKQACCYNVGIFLAGSKCGHPSTNYCPLVSFSPNLWLLIPDQIFQKWDKGGAISNRQILELLTALTNTLSFPSPLPQFCCLEALNAQDCAGTVVALKLSLQACS